MAGLTIPKVVAVLFLGVVLALFAGVAAKRRPANIDGYVYEKCADGKLVNPVRGAVISTSVDEATSTTDDTGHFSLQTKHPAFVDEFYDVTVRAGDVVVVDRDLTLVPIDPRVHPSSPRRLTYVLSPPEEVFASGDSCNPLPLRVARARQRRR